MTYVAVTLEYGNGKKDLALPMQVPSRLIIDGLSQTLKLDRRRGQVSFLGIQGEQGLRRISTNASLGEAGVLHGATLILLEDNEADSSLPDTGAFLRTESGSSYPLTSKKTLIGRSDAKSGIFVEIDLGGMISDPKIISRQHAQIEQEGDRFYLVDLGSVNGTKLNGQRIPPKERKPVWDGDVIEFGRNGVQMVFHGGGKKA